MDKLVYNAETGETTMEPFSEEDLIMITRIEEQRAIDIANMPAPEEDPHKVSALIKLQSLGLTADEAKAIVGL